MIYRHIPKPYIIILQIQNKEGNRIHKNPIFFSENRISKPINPI